MNYVDVGFIAHVGLSVGCHRRLQDVVPGLIMSTDNDTTEGAGEGVACRPLAVAPVAVGRSVEEVQIEAET